MPQKGFTPIDNTQATPQVTKGFTPIVDSSTLGVPPVPHTSIKTTLPTLNMPSSLKAFGGDIAGMAHWPTGQNPYPGMGIEQKTEAMEEERARDTSRQKAGYSRSYRAVAPVAESLGVNVPGMEEAAQRGDVGAIYGHAAAGVVPWLGVKGGMRGAEDAGTFAAIKGSRATIDEMSHNWMFNSARDSKQFLGQTKQAVEAHVGMLKKGLETADKAAIPQGQMGSINLSSLAPEIDKIAQKYKGPLEVPLDKFDRAIDSFSKISGRSPYVPLESLLDIRTGVGKLWHSARDSMDAAAVAELRDVLTEKAKDRAGELGQSKQFNSYNKVWRNLLEYEDQGALGKLLNTPSGKPFFDVLNDKNVGPQLRQLNRDLSEQAGVGQDGKQVFPEDYFKKLAGDHKDIYDFTNRREGVRGVFSAASKRPLAAIPGAIGGMAAGSTIGHPILGGMAGASTALSLADRLAAIRNMSRLGGAAEIEGRMGPRVEPDFGGGLSGKVIEQLKGGPKIGDASKAADAKLGISDPSNISAQVEQARMLRDFAESKRPMNPGVAKAAKQVEKARAERSVRGAKRHPDLEAIAADLRKTLYGKKGNK